MTSKGFEHFRQLGENVGIEFKRGGNGAQTDAFETICAFLNRFGGDLFLGVLDDGTPVGVPAGAVEPMMRHGPAFGNADELGSGTRNLFRYVRLYSGAVPVIDEEDQFKVTVPLDDDHVPESGTATRETRLKSTGLTTGLTSGLTSELDREILSFLKDNPRDTMSSTAERFGKARSVIAEHIKRLKAAGLLVREGGRARGVWKVVSPVPVSEGETK